MTDSTETATAPTGDATVDTLVAGGRVVTQNAAREVFDDGAIAVHDGEIVAVGPSDSVTERYDAETEIDASGHAVLPGLVDGHVHVSDLLLRGGFTEDRGLYDWLYNVKRPGVAAMDTDDHVVAAELYCAEALQAGVTTFVENDAELPWGATGRGITESKLAVYDRAGVRNVYARGMLDETADDYFRSLLETIQARDPGVAHVDPDETVVDTTTGIETVESLIEEFHGSAGGRQSVWIAPVVLEAMSTEGLQAAYRLAEEHDVMSTIHVAEAEVQEQGPVSGVEYLRNIGCLGEHALLAHCVQISDRDARILAETDTRVSHNLLTNLRLGTGVAPLPTLLDCGVTVCLGTDNATLSDTVNPIGDLRFVATVHDGVHRDPGLISAQTALDMVTRDAGRAIGRPDLGTLEPGTCADVVLLDLDHPHLTPCPDVVSAIVYQAQGFEVDTVLVDGEVVVADREVTTLDTTDVSERATAAARGVREQSGVTPD
ncbi:amidohydrolase family protein [Salinigranum salinum]|uniref:amidohydrolase family protein n=1 Tax=Salinigranum salinum TaxID=1364937 RepID=UPI001260AA32|nr:amidohydrolase family protein [Salinigranum salinum]